MTLPGTTEWIIILLVVMLFFGAKRLPGLARSVGKAITEFKKGTKEITDEMQLDDMDRQDEGKDGE